MNKNKTKKLEDIYKNIPKVKCKGLCYESCSNIPAEKIEIKRCKERLHFNPFQPTLSVLLENVASKKSNTCRALKNNKCTVYPLRPAICRLYGAAEGLECPFGCETKGEKISREEAYTLIMEIREL